jgi:hypothetical protein
VSMLVIGSGMAAIIIVMASGMQWSVRRSPTAPTQPLPVQLILTTSATGALLLNGLKAANLAMGADPSIHSLLLNLSTTLPTVEQALLRRISTTI